MSFLLRMTKAFP